MKTIVAFFTVTLIAFASYGQHPVIQDLNKVASVTFPDTPKAQTIKTFTIYVLKKDDLVYLAEATPVNENLRDMVSPGTVDSTYNGFIKGIIKSTNGKLIYRKSIIFNGITGLEFETVGSKKEQKFYSHHRVFYFNHTLIDNSVLYVDSLQKNDKRIHLFLNSLKLTIDRSKVRQGNSEELGYLTGKIIGFLIVIAVIVAVIGLFVFLIIKMANRPKH
jgi:hypothetical protein